MCRLNIIIITQLFSFLFFLRHPKAQNALTMLVASKREKIVSCFYPHKQVLGKQIWPVSAEK